MEHTLVLYTIGCPKCKVLEKKLNIAGLEYTVVEDIEEMTALGIKSAPALKVDDELMSFPNAMKWVVAYIKEHSEPEKKE